MVYNFWSCLGISVSAVFLIFQYWIEKAKTPFIFQEVNRMGVSELATTKSSRKIYRVWSGLCVLTKFGKIQILEKFCIHLKEGFINSPKIALFSTSWSYVDPPLIALSHMKMLALRPCTKTFACNFVCEGSVYTEYWTCRYWAILWLNLSEDTFFFVSRASKNDNSCFLVLCMESLHPSWYTAALENVNNVIQKEKNHLLLVLALILSIPDSSGCR